MYGLDVSFSDYDVVFWIFVRYKKPLNSKDIEASVLSVKGWATWKTSSPEIRTSMEKKK
jgi:hypothetical protein